ncbi:hypothetical protein [Bartonella pachyuromydis]|uniref:Uncharacterized protein n=1 Tax=Bartonella pachyuromydis TaxID=931097 RepID=A0ABP8VNS5_9HYPH
MCCKVAVLGGGISAGITLKFITHQENVTLFRSPQFIDNSIPELVPRKLFFELIGKEFCEVEIISTSAPRQSFVEWNCYNKTLNTKLSSTEQFFVYDKIQLARYLIENCKKKQIVEREIHSVSELQGFDKIYDCRGSQSISKDSAYSIVTSKPAKTSSRYIIFTLSSPSQMDVCQFWSKESFSGLRRTFFRIPIGKNKISIGCSSIPSDPVTEKELWDFLKSVDINLTKAKIYHHGIANPNRYERVCILPHVIPLGDAKKSPCPLTEYGVLSAISNIRATFGHTELSSKLLMKHKKDEVDPHLPLELFDE